MRLIYTLVLCFATLSLWGQEEILNHADEMPRFPGCESLEDAQLTKNECANRELLKFVYGNVKYPDSALVKGIEGQVVVRFVVKTDGTIDDLNIVREIGGGCGAEVLRVMNMMNEQGIKWNPGRQAGKPVNVYFNLPVKFNIQDQAPPPPPADFYTHEGHRIYTNFDQPAEYKGGAKALEEMINTNIEYPASGLDSCAIGDVTVEALVQASGQIKVITVLDYNNLGIDFQFEAIRLTNLTWGQWTAAKFKEESVGTIYQIPISFRPKGERCMAVVDSFEKAKKIAGEGNALYEEDRLEEALVKWNEAIALFPENTEFLYARGQAYLSANRMEEACQDLTKVKETLVVNWFDPILPLICK